MTLDAKYRIEMLGAVRVVRGDDEITRFRTQKTAALLGCLALHIRSCVTREQLAELFWPDLPLDAARNNLSTALSSLRSQLEPPGIKGRILIADNVQVGLNPDAVSTDVVEFEQTLDRASRCEEASEQAQFLDRAIGLYRGDLLPGVYDDWAQPWRLRLRERYAAALRGSLDLAQQLGRLDAALDAANQLIGIDPLDEEPYSLKMRLLAEAGRSGAIAEVFQRLKERLARDVGAAPSLMIVALAASLTASKDSTAATNLKTPQMVTLPSAPDTNVHHAPKPAPPQIPRPNLPLQLTRFFGRQSETAMLRSWLLPSQPSPGQAPVSQGTEINVCPRRLVTITGSGGAGKTRLAIETVVQLSRDYEGRVYFVSLAELPDARLLSYRLSHALNLGVKAKSAADPMETLASLGNDGPVLLLLDNFEQLLRDDEPEPKTEAPIGAPAAAWVYSLLERVPNVTCLVTSRRVLGLRGEQELPLSPLGLPLPRSNPSELSQCASVQLYADRARMVKPDFAVTSKNADAIAELCLRLEGMPLAIELAAAWARTLTTVKMLERLSKQLDTLASRQRDLPARHRSMRAVCEWSYALLTPALQRTFARLFVFRSGFSLDAADAVCGPQAPDDLQQLHEHSLVVSVEQPNGEIRYRMLEALRQFAFEMSKLQGDAVVTNDLHAAFFAALVKRQNEQILEQGRWAPQIIADYDNIRAALVWYMDDELKALEAMALAGDMLQAWKWSGEMTEGRSLLTTILAYPANLAPTHERAEALNALGSLSLMQADTSAAKRSFEESLSIYRRIGTPQLVAGRLYNLALACSQEGDYGQSRRLTEEALAILGSTGEPARVARYQSHLGVLAQREHDFAAARRHLESALESQRTFKDVVGLEDTITNLGNLCYRIKDYPAALRYYEESMIISLEIGLVEDTLYSMCGFAAVAMDQGNPARAARLYSAFESGLTARGTGLPQEVRAPQAEAHGRLRAALGDAVYESCVAEGRGWRLEQAVNYALQRGQFKE